MRITFYCLMVALMPLAMPQPSTVADPAPPDLKLRLAKDGWGDASLADAEKVLRSAGKQVLANFPAAKLEPIQLQPNGGPIALFKRAKDGSIIVKLNTPGRLWAQYSFQFGHELCHIMCRFDDNDTGNLWFEESLCELSSLYTLRRMAEDWKTHPPYSNWKSYAPHLTEYAQKRIDDHPLPEGTTLARWYRDNADALRQNATSRQRNTVVATALLAMFEKEPSHWAAVGYLNQGKPRERQTFAGLQNWHDQTPAEHRGFIRAVANQFELE